MQFSKLKWGRALKTFIILAVQSFKKLPEDLKIHYLLHSSLKLFASL